MRTEKKGWCGQWCALEKDQREDPVVVVVGRRGAIALAVT